MALTRERKATEVAQVAALLNDSGAVYLTDYMGLTVEQINQLRGRFHESGVRYRVVKNTLLRIALEEIGGFDALYEHLRGPSAVALSSDPSAPARAIKRFKAETGSTLPALKVAFVDGSVYAGDQLDVLSSLKSREELIGDIVGLLLSPMSNIVGAVQAPGATLAAILETLQEEAKP